MLAHVGKVLRYLLNLMKGRDAGIDSGRVASRD